MPCLAIHIANPLPTGLHLCRMPRKTLRESKLSSLRKRTDIRKRTGYAIHVTENPREAYNSCTMHLPNLGPFLDLHDAFCKLTGCETLSQAIENGFFDPLETYGEWTLRKYPGEFAKVFAMPVQELANLKDFYPDREAPLYLYSMTCEGIANGLRQKLGLRIVIYGYGNAFAFTWGLPVHIGQTLWDGVCQALQANPQASQLLSFPVKEGSAVFCPPLGQWIARPDYLSPFPAYAIQVDCLP